MSISTQTGTQLAVVIRGGTIYMNAEIFHLDGVTYQDPDTHEITFYDSSGIVQGTITNPVRDALGKYSCYLTFNPANAIGKWHVDWKIIIGGVPDIARVWFDVIA